MQDRQAGIARYIKPAALLSIASVYRRIAVFYKYCVSRAAPIFYFTGVSDGIRLNRGAICWLAGRMQCSATLLISELMARIFRDS